MDYDQRKEKYREKLQDLILMDDEFMTRVFDGNIDGATLLVQIILDKPDLKVTDVKTQSYLKNLQGHSARLDILAKDDDGRFYNIEVQRKSGGAGVKRASLNAALLLSNTCDPGCEPIDYPEIYVIFITETDVLKKGRPLYHIEQMIAEDCEEIDDGEHIVYVNGACKDTGTALGRLMHDFFCNDPRDMYYQVLADRVRYFKEDEEGVDAMCSAFQEVRQEGRQEGRKEGRKEAMRELVTTVLSKGKSPEETADLLDIALDDVRKIFEERKAEQPVSFKVLGPDASPA